MAEWYYRLEEEVQGPLNEEDFKHLFNSGALPSTTPVWREGMQDWVAAQTISLFAQRVTAAKSQGDKDGPVGFEGSSGISRQNRRLAYIGAAIACFLAFVGWGAWGNHGLFKRREAGWPITYPEAKAADKAILSITPQSPQETKIDDDPAFPKSSHEIAGSQETGAVESQGASSMDKFIQMVSTALKKQEGASTITYGYSYACTLIQAVLIRPADASKTYPEPLVGDPAKVLELLNYINEKVGALNEGEDFMLFYNRKDHVWAFSSKTQGFLVLLSDLDPTSGQIVTRQETFYGGRPTGRNQYIARFSTRNNQKRIVYYNAAGLGGVRVIDSFQLPCGYEGEQNAERVAKALAGLIVAYGGKAEVVAGS